MSPRLDKSVAESTDMRKKEHEAGKQAEGRASLDPGSNDCMVAVQEFSLNYHDMDA